MAILKYKQGAQGWFNNDLWNRHPVLRQQMPKTELEWQTFLDALRDVTQWSDATEITSANISFTGFSANPDPASTLYYKSIDGWGALIMTADLTGTSDATGFTFQAVAPVPTSPSYHIVSMIDNGSEVLGRVVIAAADATSVTVTCAISTTAGSAVAFDASGWTNSSTKGFRSGAIVYPL